MPDDEIPRLLDELPLELPDPLGAGGSSEELEPDDELGPLLELDDERPLLELDDELELLLELDEEQQPSPSWMISQRLLSTIHLAQPKVPAGTLVRWPQPQLPLELQHGSAQTTPIES